MEIRNKLVTFLRGTRVQMFSLDYPWGEEGSVQSLLESQNSFDFFEIAVLHFEPLFEWVAVNSA